jgi:hypothetical protein
VPLNKWNQREFHRRLFSEQLRPITLLKRGDNQAQGTVRAIQMWECWRGKIEKTGETIQNDMSSGSKVTWHLPRIELDRVGVAYINPADQIVDEVGRTWQPESDDRIDVKLFEVHVCVECKQVVGSTRAG